VSPIFNARAWSGVIGISRVWCAMIVSLQSFVIASHQVGATRRPMSEAIQRPRAPVVERLDCFVASNDGPDIFSFLTPKMRCRRA
jgi:hypothetical protein